MNTAVKTSDIISTKNQHIALSAVVTKQLLEVRNKIYICVSYVLWRALVGTVRNFRVP
jgi:hypothetical protein